VTPLAWYWALLVWGYAIAWFFFNDRAKLLTYRLLDLLRADKQVDPKAPNNVPRYAVLPQQPMGAEPCQRRIEFATGGSCV
jgi:hypothetical protein